MSASLKDPVANTTESPRPERNADGQYVRGNRGGPGNPFNRQIAAFRKMIIQTSTEDDVREVVQVLTRKARDGDIAAIKIFLQYVIGKPLPAVDPDRVDIDEWKLCEESNVGGEAGQAVFIDGMPVRLATQMAGVMEDVKFEKIKKQWADDEVRLAEEAEIAAAEQRAIDLGIQETIRKYREEKAAGTLPAARPPLTLDEILGVANAEQVFAKQTFEAPTANGGNTAPGSRPSAIPTANEILIGGGMPLPNGDNRGASGSAKTDGAHRRKQQVIA